MTPEQQTPASVVERLRAPHGSAYRFIAAAEIERLSAEREGLREALEWIKREDIHHEGDDVDNYDPAVGHSSRSWLGPFGRIAQAALTQGESRQTGASGWQDIATAPKDGTRVLVYFEGAGPIVAFRSGDDPNLWTRYLGFGKSTYQPAVHADLAMCWMPLPAAPTPADGGGE